MQELLVCPPAFLWKNGVKRYSTVILENTMDDVCRQGSKRVGVFPFHVYYLIREL